MNKKLEQQLASLLGAATPDAVASTGPSQPISIGAICGGTQTFVVGDGTQSCPNCGDRKQELLQRASQPSTLHEQLLRDIKEYEEFHAATGIRASRPERAAIARLLLKHPFTIKQIKCVWDDLSLFYREGRLQVTLPRWSMLFGTSLFIMAELMALPLVYLCVFAGATPLQQLMMFLAFALVTVFAAVFIRPLVAPYFLAKRLQKALGNGLKS